MLKSTQAVLKKLGGTIFLYSGLFHFLRLINNLRGKRLTVVTYHRVTDRDIQEIDSSLPYLFVNSKTFDRQLRFLKKHYHVLTFAELERHKDSRSLPWNSLVVTFDDGYKDFHEHAYPMLKSLGIPSTLFLTAGRIGKKDFNPFWWDRAYHHLTRLSSRRSNDVKRNLAPEIERIIDRFRTEPSVLFQELNTWNTVKVDKLLDEIEKKVTFSSNNLSSENKMLDWKELHEMNGMVESGSHTCTHPNLTRLGNRELQREIRESREVIKKNTGGDAKVFAYPAGNADNRIIEVVKDSGYGFAVTTVPGVNDLSDRYSLKRINVWEGTSCASLGSDSFSEGLFSMKLLNFRKRLW